MLLSICSPHSFTTDSAASSKFVSHIITDPTRLQMRRYTTL